MYWLIGGAVAYGAAVGGLYFMQDGMIFPRHAAEQAQYPLPPHAEQVALRTDDGHELIGHLVCSLGQSKGLLIGFSGNAWNAEDCLVFVSHRVKDWDIAIFHYRGYGPSSGKPSEAALFSDALLIHDHLVEALAPEQVVGIGFSLGSGVVSYLAAERPLAGQVLFTPFDSIRAVASRRYRLAPVNHLIKHPFDSVAHQRRAQAPAAVVLASHDRVVPRPHSEKLIESLQNPVFVETIPDSSHGSIYDLDAVDEVLRMAIREVANAGTGTKSGRGL